MKLTANEEYEIMKKFEGKPLSKVRHALAVAKKFKKRVK